MLSDSSRRSKHARITIARSYTSLLAYVRMRQRSVPDEYQCGCSALARALVLAVAMRCTSQIAAVAVRAAIVPLKLFDSLLTHAICWPLVSM